VIETQTPFEIKSLGEKKKKKERVKDAMEIRVDEVSGYGDRGLEPQV
jgi:hypothetical protein